MWKLFKNFRSRKNILELTEDRIHNVTRNGFKVGFGCIDSMLAKTTLFFDKDLLQEREIIGQRRLNPKSIGECRVEVYGPNEGSIPHFHIFNSDKSLFNSIYCLFIIFLFPRELNVKNGLCQQKEIGSPQKVFEKSSI